MKSKLPSHFPVFFLSSPRPSCGQRSSHVENVSSHITTSNYASHFKSPSTTWATLERTLSALNQGDITPESQALVNSIIDPSAHLPTYPAEEVRMLVILHQTKRALVDAKQTHAKATFITEVAWNPSEHDLPDHLYRMMGLFASLNDKGVIIPDLIRAACLLSSVEKSGEDFLTHVISDNKLNAHGVDIVLRTLISTIPIATAVTTGYQNAPTAGYHQEIDLLRENDLDNLSVNSVSIQSALPSSNRYRRIFPIDVSRYLNPRPLTYPALPDPSKGVSSSAPPDNLEDDFLNQPWDPDNRTMGEHIEDHRAARCAIKARGDHFPDGLAVEHLLGSIDQADVYGYRQTISDLRDDCCCFEEVAETLGIAAAHLQRGLEPPPVGNRTWEPRVPRILLRILFRTWPRFQRLQI